MTAGRTNHTVFASASAEVDLHGLLRDVAAYLQDRRQVLVAEFGMDSRMSREEDLEKLHRRVQEALAEGVPVPTSPDASDRYKAKLWDRLMKICEQQQQDGSDRSVMLSQGGCTKTFFIHVGGPDSTKVDSYYKVGGGIEAALQDYEERNRN